MDRTLGAADARFTDAQMGGAAILQDPAGERNTPAGDYDSPGKSWPEGPTDVTKAIPAGSKVLTDSNGTAKLTTAHGLLQTEVRELAAADPVARGIMRLREGRFPRRTTRSPRPPGSWRAAGCPSAPPSPPAASTAPM